MNQFSKFLLFIVVAIIFINCKTVHKTKTRIEGTKVTRNEILEKLQQPDLKYNWFFAKAKIEIEDSKNNNTVNAIIRMKKDSVIWISLNAILGIEVSRILITPDSVRLMDKFNKRYYKKDFNYIKQITHMPGLTFDILQRAITGSELSFGNANPLIEKVDSSYKILSSENQVQNIIWVNALNLTLSKKRLEDKVINQSYEMNYADYRLLADRLFSFKRKVKINSQADNNYQLGIEYNKVILDEPQRIPFNVPEKYEVIK
ncbi:MAG: hypothetical protein RJA07_2720 [Bacteroidota bacterium]|jgi:hypothetical protein